MVGHSRSFERNFTVDREMYTDARSPVGSFFPVGQSAFAAHGARTVGRRINILELDAVRECLLAAYRLYRYF